MFTLFAIVLIRFIISDILFFISDWLDSNCEIWSSLALRIANFVLVTPLPLANDLPFLSGPNMIVRASCTVFCVVHESGFSFARTCSFSYKSFQVDC